MMKIVASDPAIQAKVFFSLLDICRADSEKLSLDTATGDVTFMGDATPMPDGSLSPSQVVAELVQDEIVTFTIAPATDAVNMTFFDPWVPTPSPVPLCSRGAGAWPTGFQTVPTTSGDTTSILTDVAILYDVNDYPAGQEYRGYLPDGTETPIESTHLLAFSLASATQIAIQLEQTIPADSTTPWIVQADLSLQMENTIRVQGGFDPRVDPIDIYLQICPLQPGKHVGPPPPPSKVKDGYWWKGCFVATAAFGSPFAPEVNELRRLRDQVLRRTRLGEAWFERFYASYYDVSPAISDRMKVDAEFAQALRVGIVQPYVGWLEVAATMPDAAVESVPEPWRAFIVQLQDRLDRWANEIGVPTEFAGLSSSEIARELAVVLRFGIRDRSRRAEYLGQLRKAGVLPLHLTAAERSDVREALLDLGLAPDQVALVIPSQERA